MRTIKIGASVRRVKATQLPGSLRVRTLTRTNFGRRRITPAVPLFHFAGLRVAVPPKNRPILLNSLRVGNRSWRFSYRNDVNPDGGEGP